METISIKILIITVVFLFFLILFGIFKFRDGDKSNGKTQPISQSFSGSQFVSSKGTDNGFHVRLLVGNKQGGKGVVGDVMRLQIKGLLSYYTESFPVLLETRYLDVTEGDKAPKRILINGNDNNEHGTKELHEITEFTPPNEENIIRDWRTVSTIPTQELTFSKHGRRRIKVFLDVKRQEDDSLADNMILTSAQCECDCFAFCRGYDEMEEYRQLFEKDLMSIARNLMERLGKKDDFDISSLIHKWILDSHIYPESEISQVEKRMLGYYGKPGIFRKKNIDICEDIITNAQISEIYSGIDLLLEIASWTKDTFNMDDLREIDKIAQKLGVDMGIYNERKHKKIDFLMSQLVSQDSTRLDMETILGINPYWMNGEKSDYLNKLYNRWNPIQTHKDPKKRRQAEDMIKLIAKYKNNIA